jgi:hypothetical protein
VDPADESLARIRAAYPSATIKGERLGLWEFSLVRGTTEFVICRRSPVLIEHKITELIGRGALPRPVLGAPELAADPAWQRPDPAIGWHLRAG